MERTLESIIAQERAPERLLLIDNASTDGTSDICRKIMQTHPEIETHIISEPQPGKIFALEAACRMLTT
ncbi:MAG: glycosyltransferase family A protein, partial [Pyrinomonadaceae bacterium]